MKQLDDRPELTEEEREAQEQAALEVALFEEFEMPVFLALLEAHADLDPQDALYGLSAVFWYGWAGWGSCTSGKTLHGHTPGEVAKILYDNAEAGRTTYPDVALGLLESAKHGRSRQWTLEQPSKR